MKAPHHMARVAQMPCSICGLEPVEVHHLRHPAITGGSQRANDMLTIPLCKLHHKDFHDHMGRKDWEMAFGDQFDHLTDTLYKLYGRHQ